jgi:hypothetical protein
MDLLYRGCGHMHPQDQTLQRNLNFETNMCEECFHNFRQVPLMKRQTQDLAGSVLELTTYTTITAI